MMSRPVMTAGGCSFRALQLVSVPPPDAPCPFECRSVVAVTALFGSVEVRAEWAIRPRKDHNLSSGSPPVGTGSAKWQPRK